MGPSQMLSTSQQHPRVAPALVLLQPGSLVQPPPLLHCKATAPALLLAHPQLCPGGIPTYPTHCWRGLWVDSPPLAPVAWNLDGKRDREGNVQGQVLLPCRELPGVRARAGAAAQVLQLTVGARMDSWGTSTIPQELAQFGLPTHLLPKTEQGSANRVLVMSPEGLPHSQQSCCCPPWLSPSALYSPSGQGSPSLGQGSTPCALAPHLCGPGSRCRHPRGT